MNFREFWRHLIGYLIPTTCVGCCEFGVNLCTRCENLIKFVEYQVCPNCRYRSAHGVFCSNQCREKIFDNTECFLDGVFVACRYEKDGIIEKLITRFKYKFSDEIKEILCPLIAGIFDNAEFDNAEDLALDLDFDFVIPVPLHSKREKMRGFNQAEILAGACHDLKKLNILKRKYNTFPQAKLNRRGRLVNLTNAFELKISSEEMRQFYNKSFVIIDDVCTTGSTLNECARALQPLRPKKIYGLVLARG